MLALGLVQATAAAAGQRRQAIPAGGDVDGGHPKVLPAVVVVADPGDPSVPASLDWRGADDVPAWPRAQVPDLLRRIPGVAARDRQNLAQDLQLTVRGVGARTTFGVRGLRLYVDGIPATMPDGQGQLSHVPLSALDGVEVLRGPFSALYGNAAGGVVRFWSKPPAAAPEATLSASAGSDARNLSIGWSGPWRPGDAGGDRDAGGGGYRLDAERLDADGFRRHSRARRDVAQARTTWRTRGGTDVALTANRLALRADDPQGLTLDQVRADPRAASAGALAFDTRKDVRQAQAGVRVSRGAAGDIDGAATGTGASWSLGAYAGQRATWQMLSIPAQAQAAPGSGGGVVDLDRDYGGADLRGAWQGTLAGRPFALAAGLEWQRSSERRRGYENFAGDTLGVVGALRRDQRDSATSRDAYAEVQWRFLPRWRATLGVRRSRVAFDSRDRYVAPGNGDDSGALAYAATTPVLGLLYVPAEGIELYVDAGRGFETPSGSELAYRPDGRSGLNDALAPATTRSVEAGMRLRAGAHRIAAAAFDARTRDELVVASNLGGRSTYANAARTRRSGFELSASGPVGAHWRYALAWTTLEARNAAAFATCRAPPCASPDTIVPAGNRIPATAARSGWAELRWSPRADVDVFISGQGSGRVWADDANTASAPGYATFDAGVERRWRAGTRPVAAFARVTNLLDRRTIGSVIVNEGNGRYFEPAPGRGVVLGVRVGGAP
ncbi:MAG: TonB-dependent receptor family protein [Luteimonas sp.]